MDADRPALTRQPERDLAAEAAGGASDEHDLLGLRLAGGLGRRFGGGHDVVSA